MAEIVKAPQMFFLVQFNPQHIENEKNLGSHAQL
jgi:hypothetical protein